jgi:uncharacterized protein
VPEPGAPKVNLPKYNPNAENKDGRSSLPKAVLIFAIFILLLIFAFLYSSEELTPRFLHYSQKNVLVDNRLELKVDLANTEKKRLKGLSDRAELGEGMGMLFTFEDATDTFYPVFWMKNTLIPLDIIWIAGGEIVYIERNAQPADPDTPDNELSVYSPPVPVDMVLEVPGGWSEDNGVLAGQAFTVED